MGWRRRAALFHRVRSPVCLVDDAAEMLLGFRNPAFAQATATLGGAGAGPGAGPGARASATAAGYAARDGLERGGCRCRAFGYTRASEEIWLMRRPEAWLMFCAVVGTTACGKSAPPVRARATAIATAIASDVQVAAAPDTAPAPPDVTADTVVAGTPEVEPAVAAADAVATPAVPRTTPEEQRTAIDAFFGGGLGKTALVSLDPFLLVVLESWDGEDEHGVRVRFGEDKDVDRFEDSWGSHQTDKQRAAAVLRAKDKVTKRFAGHALYVFNVMPWPEPVRERAVEQVPVERLGVDVMYGKSALVGEAPDTPAGFFKVLEGETVLTSRPYAHDADDEWPSALYSAPGVSAVVVTTTFAFVGSEDKQGERTFPLSWP